MKKIIIGTRGSELALWQANYTLEKLNAIGLDAELKIIRTQGDAIQHLSFDKLEGKGFFTKEIEEALLNKEIDLAVHSHKDLPTTSPEGLMIAAVSEREDPSELLLIRKDKVDKRQKFSLSENALVGSSSARRKSQLLAFRPDIELSDLRGNVPTRIQKLRDKKYDAILLAAAGVHRLQLPLNEFHVERLSPLEFIPAPAQGVLAWQIRSDDKELLTELQKLHHREVAECIQIERKVLNLFDGGCQLPLGAYCSKEEGVFKIHVAKAQAWNSVPRYLYAENTKGGVSFAESIVFQLSKEESKKIFITRETAANDTLSHLLTTQGHHLRGVSFIRFQPISFDHVPSAEWIFFSSKNAVRYFFEQVHIPPAAKYAAIGKATAAALSKYVSSIDFYGESNDTIEIGKQFADKVKSGKVLFPQSTNGLRTVQKQFANPQQLTDLAVYETLPMMVDAEDDIYNSDLLIFTSPSNVDSFLQQHKISQKHQLIAMGKSTAKQLEKRGYKEIYIPPTPDDIGLAQIITQLL